MKAMVPSDAIDLNRPMATGRLVPATLVQEKVGLPKSSPIPGSVVSSRTHVRLNDVLRIPCLLSFLLYRLTQKRTTIPATLYSPSP